MSAPRVRLAEMSPEQRAAAKGSPVATVKAIHGHGPKFAEPYASKVERDFAMRLEMRRMAGELRSVTHQPDPIELPADRCTYTADFRVTEASGAVTFYETKGARKGARGKTVPHFHDEAARIKTKLAARVMSQQTPPARLVVVWPAANGGWSERVVKP